MDSKVKIKKVPLEELIDTLVDLYNKGIDYVDIVPDPEKNRLSLIFSADYLSEEAKDEWEVIIDDVDKKLSDEDLNQLI